MVSERSAALASISRKQSFSPIQALSPEPNDINAGRPAEPLFAGSKRAQLMRRLFLGSATTGRAEMPPPAEIVQNRSQPRSLDPHPVLQVQTEQVLSGQERWSDVRRRRGAGGALEGSRLVLRPISAL